MDVQPHGEASQCAAAYISQSTARLAGHRRSSGEGTNASSPRTIYPLLLRATTTAVGGVHQAAPSRPFRDVVPAKNSMSRTPCHSTRLAARRRGRRRTRKSPGLLETSSPLRTPCRLTRRSSGPDGTRRGRRQSSSGGAPVIKLEQPSDDVLYRPKLPRFGEAGQGSSCQAPPPQDGGDSSNDGGDYTAFYH
jgi:hypothetical protein